MTLLTLKDIHVTIGDRHLLQGVSLVVGDGDRIGLLGANGCGKSTLLRILAGELVPDSGDRALRRDLRLGFLPQEPVLPAEATVHEAVVRGLETIAENIPVSLVLNQADAVQVHGYGYYGRYSYGRPDGSSDNSGSDSLQE